MFDRPHIENLYEMRRYRFTLTGGPVAECVEGTFTGITVSVQSPRIGVRVKEKNAKKEVFIPWGNVADVVPLAGGSA